LYQSRSTGQFGYKDIADLKGKTIGVDAIGGGPMIALSIALRSAGLDPQKDVQWKAYPGPQLDQAIANGEIQGLHDMGTHSLRWMR